MALTKVTNELLYSGGSGGGTTALATADTPGLAKPGTGMSVDNTGAFNVTPTGAATDTEFGLVKIKLNGGINNVGGELSVNAGSVPTATDLTSGTIKVVSGSGISYDPTENILRGTGTAAPLASETEAGLVRIGTGFNFDAATATINVLPGGTPLATQTTPGTVMGGLNTTIGPNGEINVSAGTGNAQVTDWSNRNGVVPAPPAVDGWVVTNDQLDNMTRINMGKWFDPSLYRDRSQIMNKILMFASRAAKKARGTGFWTLQMSPSLEVFGPMGDYVLKEQICVPSGVEFNCRGVIYRDNSGFSSSGDGPARTALAANVNLNDTYVPAVVTSHYGAINRLYIQGHVTGHANAGSGFCSANIYRAEFGTTDTTTRNAGYEKLKDGSGYGPGQTFALAHENQNFKSSQNDDFPLKCARIKVLSVWVNGAKTTDTTARGPLADWEVQQAGWHEYGISALAEYGHYSNGTTGAGAVFRAKKYAFGFTGSGGGAHWDNATDGIFMMQHLKEVNAIECGRVVDADPTRGYHKGIQIKGLNTEAIKLYALNCRVGLFLSKGGDLRILNYNTVLCGTALRLFGFSSGMISNFAFDSSWWNGIHSTGSLGIKLNGRSFWENGNDKPFNSDGSVNVYGRPNQSGYHIICGEGGSPGQLQSNLDWDISLVNMGGPTQNTTKQPAIFMDGVSKCYFFFKATNSEYAGRIHPNTKVVSTLIEFGETYVDFTDSVDGKTYTNYRRLRNDNMFMGSCAHLTGPLFIGDPGDNYLNFWDPEAQGVIGPSGVYTMYGNGSPSNTAGSETGRGKAPTGSLYIRKTQATNLLWINSGTRSTPFWKVIS